MWSGITGFFSIGKGVGEKKTTNKEIIEEIRNVKKLLRKQGIFQGAFKDEVLKQIEQKNLENIKSIIEFTDALFYLCESLKEMSDSSLNQDEAIDIVWQKWKPLISSIDLEIIYEAEVRFDPRLHEALENLSHGARDLTVLKIIQPGYLYKGNVARPAKAIIGEQRIQEGSFV